MTRAARFLRALRDRCLGTFFEGPEPPARLVEMVALFVASHPDATRGDWEAFAIAHAAECYRLGYVRGEESWERAPELRPSPTPDEVADHVDQGWRERRGGITITGRDEVVPEERAEEELMVRTIERTLGFRS